MRGRRSASISWTLFRSERESRVYLDYRGGFAGLGDCSQPAIRQKITDYAGRYGIDPAIALKQINQESGCRANVCSYQGACGIAQFIASTWARYGRGSRTDVDASLDAWGRYMSHLLSLFGGDYRLALAGYHTGEGKARAALGNCKGNPRTCGYVNAILGGAPPPAIEKPAQPGQPAQPGRGQPNAPPVEPEPGLFSNPLVWVALVAILVLRR